MKKILSLVIACCAFISVSFAQSASFEDTYAKLMDTSSSTTITPESAIVESGSQTIILKGNVDENNKGSIEMNIDYNATTANNKKGMSVDMNLKIASKINAVINSTTINNLQINADGQAIITPKMIYFKLNTVSIDTSGLPVEMQGNGDMVLGYIKSTVLGKWIKIPLDKKISQSLQNKPTVNPADIIKLLKQYPIIKNMGYANGAYTVKLDSNNIMKLIERFAKSVNPESKSMSYKDKKELITTINTMPLQGTLSDSNKPTLLLTSQKNNDGLGLNSEISISNTDINLSGTLFMPAGDAEVSFSINRPQEQNIQNYNIFINYKPTESSGDPKLSLNMYGTTSLSYLDNYTITLPKKAMTMKQLEKKMNNIYK